MACSININNFVVNSLTNNSNINFGGTLQNSHTANSSITGGNFNNGDGCLMSSKSINFGNAEKTKEDS
ncbi:spore germination protein [Bacillus sp. S3]|uniref:spore germination protein n=1 Tax=Bacillus sp. S3 TaxID=486398 RepID=UPI001CC1E38C|nr:spore germination protein [Bacillus sp. S3]